MNVPQSSNRDGEVIKHIGFIRQRQIGMAPIQPNDFLLFCDLQDQVLDGLDLSQVEFLGCRLNGTSFRDTTLKGARFIGCFSSYHGLPTDFRHSSWQDASFIESHLYCIHSQDISDSCHWPNEVADAAWDTLASRNYVRYRGTCKLGELNDRVVAPLLACLLADDDWEVRGVALEALQRFRRYEKFPYQDLIMLEWMFLGLGDEHSLVRRKARKLVEDLSPPDHILLTATRRMMGHSREEKLAGLRAAIELCLLDASYSRLVNPKIVESLLKDEIPEVRNESERLLLKYTNARKAIHVKDTALSDNQSKATENQAIATSDFSSQVPKYIETPDRSFTIEGEIYMLQRRPMHPHIVVNDNYQGIRILDPWLGTDVIQVIFTQGYDTYGAKSGWCFRSDGKAVLVLNEVTRNACLLSLEAEGSSYSLKSPPLRKTTDLRYVWENDSFWLTGGKSFAYFNLQWHDGEPIFVERGGIYARIEHRAWCQALDQIQVLSSQVLRVEPDKAQMIFYDSSKHPETIGVLSWRDKTKWSVPAVRYVPLMAFHKEYMFLMYEHEVHAINQHGVVVAIYNTPEGFFGCGLDTIPPQDTYPAALVLACSSISEPKHSQILVYRLDD